MTGLLVLVGIVVCFVVFVRVLPTLLGLAFWAILFGCFVYMTGYVWLVLWLILGG